MVGLFYGLGIDKQNNLVDGMIALIVSRGAHLPCNKMGRRCSNPLPSAPEDSARSYALKSEESDQPEAAPPKGEMAPCSHTDFPPPLPYTEMEQESASDAAIGGVLSTQLCTLRGLCPGLPSGGPE